LGDGTGTSAHTETHPSDERAPLIHAVTQAGVLADGAAVEVDVCAETLAARSAIYTVAMIFLFASIVGSWQGVWGEITGGTDSKSEWLHHCQLIKLKGVGQGTFVSKAE
jgi:hypothetical protein